MNSTAAPRSLQRAHDAEQALDLVAGERRGRLVHDQHARVEARAPWRSRRSADRRCERPRTGCSGSSLTPRRSSSSCTVRCSALRSMRRSEPSGWRPIITFSAMRQVGEERRLLVDHRDARVARVGRAVEGDRPRRRPARRPRRDAARRRASARSSTCRRRSRPPAPGPRRRAARSRRSATHAPPRRTCSRPLGR